MVDPLQITNAAADKETRNDDATAEPAASKTLAAAEVKEENATASNEGSNKTGVDDKLKIAAGFCATNAATTTATSTAPTADTEEQGELVKNDQASASATVPKDEEMLSTIANIKQEVNTTPSNSEYPQKEIPLFIKKEPSEEEAADNTNSNSNSNEPHDLKMISDIKSEGKCGLDLTDHENKYADTAASSAPGPPAKFGAMLPGPPPMPLSAVDGHAKYPPEPSKYADAHKYASAHGLPIGLKYPGGPEHNKYASDPSGKGEMKGYMDSRYHEGPPKGYLDGTNSEHPQSLKVYPEQQQPTDLKYAAPEIQNKYTPPILEASKYELSDSVMNKRPPYPDPHQPMRSPYDPNQLMKYGDPMQKFGLPPHMGGVGPPELKYRPPEGLVKPPFSTDPMMKGTPYAEYPGALKYQPSESPIDASARSTPNQDSQSSNSNLPPHLPATHSNTASPQTNSSHLNHLPPTGGPPLLLGPGAPGMPPHPAALAHLPPSHPSMVPPNSSPSVTPVSVNPPSHLPPSTVSSPMQQPLGLLGHPGVHRPPDMPPLMHHPSAPFPTGLPPPHTSAHPHISSPALNASRSEQERAEQRRIESIHHGSSPGLMPPTSAASLLGHPGLPLHLSGNMPPTGIPLLPPHHAHLGPPLLPPASNAPLSLIGAPPMSTPSSVSSDGRRTPGTLTTSSSHPTTPITSSAFSRTSPSVQFANLPPSAHRSASPSQPVNSSLTRASPLHLSHHSSASALSAAAAASAALERDRQALMRQQSPHMTPPPPVSSASLVASPLSKMYGPQSGQPRSSPPPPHHLRPGASPPVRHPQMPLPLPLPLGPGMPPQIGLHPVHNPYSHHLMHPMFYPHQHPFNSPYPYHPYAPGFQYLKHQGPGMDPSAALPHHPSANPRMEEAAAAHADKQAAAAAAQSAQQKVYKTFTFLLHEMKISSNKKCTQH